jgi:hypothetical protein
MKIYDYPIEDWDIPTSIGILFFRIVRDTESSQR